MVQSLIIFCLAGAQIDHKGPTYYSNLAVSRAYEYGFHRDQSKNPFLTVYEKKMYKILYSFLCVRECAYSLCFGRPTMIKSEDADVIPITREDFIFDGVDEATDEYFEFTVQCIKLANLIRKIVSNQTEINALCAAEKAYEHLVKQNDKMIISSVLLFQHIIVFYLSKFIRKTS
ncbi:unnamed protein product [Ambrosiozyma monospora]|uniref:Unnamed protein product n=1 Tax=Ambrosiozyma monospora TaxID=43982 RepID=A0ACB5UAZ1_AMBMO|nr:unnamed protein product [Ambrosiozyma monospora]